MFGKGAGGLNGPEGPDKTQGPGGFSWCEGLPPNGPSEWGRGGGNFFLKLHR